MALDFVLFFVDTEQLLNYRRGTIRYSPSSISPIYSDGHITRGVGQQMAKKGGGAIGLLFPFQIWKAIRRLPIREIGK